MGITLSEHLKQLRKENPDVGHRNYCGRQHVARDTVTRRTGAITQTTTQPLQDQTINNNRCRATNQRRNRVANVNQAPNNNVEPVLPAPNQQPAPVGRYVPAMAGAGRVIINVRNAPIDAFRNERHRQIRQSIEDPIDRLNDENIARARNVEEIARQSA